jgi:hypothetical protein
MSMSISAKLYNEHVLADIRDCLARGDADAV